MHIKCIGTEKTTTMQMGPYQLLSFLKTHIRYLQVLEYDRSLVADERVKMEVMTSHEALPLSPYGDGVFGFEVVRASIHQVWLHHNVSVAPGQFIFKGQIFPIKNRGVWIYVLGNMLNTKTWHIRLSFQNPLPAIPNSHGLKFIEIAFLKVRQSWFVC